MQLRDMLELLEESYQSVEVYPEDSDELCYTMVECSLADFTDEGLEEFKDVLDATVTNVVAGGENFLRIYVTGCKPSRVIFLGQAHAGYIEHSLWVKYFTMDAKWSAEAKSTDVFDGDE